jgi:hypothetical protein
MNKVGIVKLEVSHAGSMYDITCNSLGLFLSGSDFEKLRKSIIPAIKRLWKLNHKQDVEVIPQPDNLFILIQ